MTDIDAPLLRGLPSVLGLVERYCLLRRFPFGLSQEAIRTHPAGANSAANHLFDIFVFFKIDLIKYC